MKLTRISVKMPFGIGVSMELSDPPEKKLDRRSRMVKEFLAPFFESSEMFQNSTVGFKVSDPKNHQITLNFEIPQGQEQDVIQVLTKLIEEIKS